MSYVHDPDSLCFAQSVFFKLNFLKKTLWYHLRRTLNGSLHTLFKASSPKTHPVQNAKKIIPCLRLKNLKTMYPVQRHVHFIYLSRPNKSVPLSGVCSWYTAILGSRNHVEVKKPVQSVRPVTVVIVCYMYESYNI